MVIIVKSFSNDILYTLIFAIPCVLLATSYLLNNPNFITGKNKNGKRSITLSVLNSPWLIITYICWYISSELSKEDKCNKIINNIFISRYPVVVPNDEFDLIIDLTSEFPKPKIGNNNYLCVPNLDGVALKNINIPEIDPKSKVLIHCAQGHGRSSSYCALVLIKLGIANSTFEALNIIKKSRPGAVPSKSQLKQLLKLENKYKSLD